MQRLLLAAAFICLISIPKQAQCQFNRARVTKYITDYVNQHEKQSKPSWREREEERKEEEQRKRIQNQIESMSDSDLLSHIDDPDYHYMIMNDYSGRLMNALYNSENLLKHYKNDNLRNLITNNPYLMGKVINNMRSQKEKILDFARDSHLKDLLMSDPELREYYEKMQVKQDIRQNPRKSLVYAKDPKWKQLFLEDYELKKILADEKEKKAKEDYDRQIRLAEDEKREQERIAREKQKEIKRKEDEKNKAHDQEVKNQKEQEAVKVLQKAIMSSPAFAQLPDLSISIPTPSDLMVSDPIKYFGINYTDGLAEEEYFDELLGGDSPRKNTVSNKPKQKDISEDYFSDDYDSFYKAKWDCFVYNSKEKLEKSWEISKKLFTTIVSEAPETTKKKIVSIPISKGKELIRETVNIGFPGASLEEKSEEIIEIGKDKKKFIEGSLNSIKEVVVTNDLRKFEESTTLRIEKFDDKNRSRLKKSSLYD